MKFIHCADLHLDSKLESNLSSEKAKERKKELLLTFERLVKYADDNQVTGIIIAGDLFDSTRISKMSHRFVKELITDHPHIEFLYVQGNHEKDQFLEGFDELPTNLKVFGEDWTSFSYENVVISGVCFTPQNNRSIYDALVLEQDKVNIVVLHGQDTQYDIKDKAENINIRALQNKYIDYLALGHIHQYKSQQLDHRGTYCYCGCLEGRGFDECGEKGFVQIEVAEGKLSYRFVPFAFRELVEVPVDITGLHTVMEIVHAIEPLVAHVEQKSLVKVVLQGEVEVDAELDLTFLQKRFESDFYYFKIKDQTRLAINYEDYRLDQSLKGEFIRMLEQADLSDEEKDDIIVLGIRALSGEEL